MGDRNDAAIPEGVFFGTLPPPDTMPVKLLETAMICRLGKEQGVEPATCRARIRYHCNLYLSSIKITDARAMLYGPGTHPQQGSVSFGVARNLDDSPYEERRRVKLFDRRTRG